MGIWNPFVELPSFVKKCVEFGPSSLGVAPSGLLRSFDGWNFYDEAVIVIIGGGGRERHCARLPLSLDVTRHGFTENGS